MPLGFTCVELPEECLLPIEEDPDQKKIQELVREVNILKNRTPVLRLAFEGRSEHLRIRLAKLPLKSAGEISQVMSDIRKAQPKAPKPESYSGADVYRGVYGAARHRSPQWTDGIEFYLDYESYLRASDEYEDLQRRLIQLNFLLLNDGSSPAEDIDISMHLPDGLVDCGGS